MSVITSVVAENTQRVISIHDMPSQMIADQIQAIFEDITVDGVKVGMLSGVEQMLAVSEQLERWKPLNIVVDPVMVAKGGCSLMQREALEALKAKIIPLADLLTPNIPEAEAITGMTLNNVEQRKLACEKISEMGAKAVLIKGGHAKGDAVDLLFVNHKFYTFATKRIDTKNTHGTGCTLSSAIAVNLAKKLSVCSAVEEAKRYITGAIENALSIGKGHGPTHHFYELYGKGE